jgi:hypothetical protein
VNFTITIENSVEQAVARMALEPKLVSNTRDVIFVLAGEGTMEWVGVRDRL